MAKYDEFLSPKHEGRPVLVEAARRDGSGKNIENNYAKQNGSYSTLTAGLAEGIATNRQIEDLELACPPITMGTTGGDAEIQTGNNPFENLEGNSKKWNQQCYTRNGTKTFDSGPTVTISNSDNYIRITGTCTTTGYLDLTGSNIPNAIIAPRFIVNHKYLIKLDQDLSSYNGWFQIEYAGIGVIKKTVIVTCTHSGDYWQYRCVSGETYDIATRIQVFDLTAIYGAGNEPTTVEEFKKDYGAAYYAYNPGTILSAKSASLISRGRQQWDEVKKVGYYLNNGVETYVGDNYYVSQNYISTIENQQYAITGAYGDGRIAFYDINQNFISDVGINTLTNTNGYRVFTTPSGCSYMKFYNPTANTNKIVVSIFWEDGEGYDQYYPYEAQVVELPNIELRAIGDLKDIAYASGGGKRRLSTYTFTGEENIALEEASLFIVQINDVSPLPKNYGKLSLIGLEGKTSYTEVYNTNYSMAYNTRGSNLKCFFVRLISTSTAEDVKTFLTGKTLIYELAEEEDIPASENPGWTQLVKTDNYGTLEFTTDPAQIPQVEQPYFIKYTISLTEFLDSTYVRAEGNASDIALESDLKNGKLVPAKSLLADNLDSDVVQNDITAYNFRTAGGSNEIGDICKEKGIIGGSLGFNQLLQNSNFASVDWWGISWGATASASVSNNIWTATLTNIEQNSAISFVSSTMTGLVLGHRYLFQGFVKSSRNNVGYVSYNNRFAGGRNVNLTADVWADLSIVLTYNYSASPQSELNIYLDKNYDAEVGDIYQFKNFMLVDLTAMLGETIANYINSLEQNHAGDGVAWFRRYWQKSYYPYTPIGAFQNVKTSGKKYVGFNQFSGIIEQGNIGSNGGPETASSRCRTSEFIQVIPNTIYYAEMFNAAANTRFMFLKKYDAAKNYLGDTWMANQQTYGISIPEGVYFIKFTFAKSDTTSNITPEECGKLGINFRDDGERDGEYEPYQETIYNYDPVELIGIPKIDGQGNLYFDGNRYNHDGTIDKRFVMVDLGSLTWDYESGAARFRATLPYSAGGAVVPNAQHIFANIFTTAKYANKGDGSDKSMFIFKHDENKSIYIYDSDYNTSAALTTAVTGFYLIYELAEPSEDSATAFQEVQEINNWGTEEYLNLEDDTRPCEVPVGHDTDYPLNCKSKIEILPGLPQQDGDYICHVESGTGEYIPLGTWLSSNNYTKDVDVSDKFTPIAGLTVDYLKARQIGNTITLDVNLTNNTGADIAANTKIIDIDSSVLGPTRWFEAHFASSSSLIGYIHNSQLDIKLNKAWPSNAQLQFQFTYCI